MLLLAACASENGLSTSRDHAGGEVPRDDRPEDTLAPDLDTGSADTGEPPAHQPGGPWARIVSPSPGETRETCDGVTIDVQVGDDDTPVGELALTVRGGGDVLWAGAPAADGSVSVPWDPGYGEKSIRVDVADPTGLTAEATATFTLTEPSATPTFTWARSPMSSRVGATAVGACVADALALPTSTSNVWDTGDHTPDSAETGRDAGRTWASWDQRHTVDCHLVELTVEIPSCGDYGALRIASPWFDGMPINDNIYVMFDGAVILTSGTSYDAGREGPAETDLWLAEAVEIPLMDLEPGTNTVQIVVEEYDTWGGLGYLEPSLE
ncbi:MAG: hypothetical protein ACOZNI_12520 [Myxococcota bacterium]